MTLQELLKSSKIWITPADVSSVLQCDPQCIRVQAQKDPSMLGYPVIVIGSRVRIPRIPFLKYLGVI